MKVEQSGSLIPIIEAIGNISKLLVPTSDGQDRKNLRVAKRMHKHLKKQFSKDGLDEQEKSMLKALETNIWQRTMSLGED